MAHILVVDDDSDMRALVRGALERDGHAVTALACGAQVTPEHCAWAHCILLDVMMPGEDGFATCAYPRPGRVPILFLTARAEETDVLRGLALAATIT
ncbi:MAG: response regulator [Ruthenibacterium lactatiformans]